MSLPPTASRFTWRVDGDREAPLTIVFAHGFTLSMDSFHFQRRDLGDVARLVFYDQRSHGRSGRSAPENATIDQLGLDLYAVLQAVAPAGPVVLVGHSMGGMTILALADQHPELFGDRVVGVALLATSTGDFAKTIVRVCRAGRRGSLTRPSPHVAKVVRKPGVVARAQPQARHRLRLHGDALSVVRT